MNRENEIKNIAESGEPRSLSRFFFGHTTYTRFRSLLKRLPKENTREMIRLMTLKDNLWRVK